MENCPKPVLDESSCPAMEATFWEMTPDALGNIILFQRERLPAEIFEGIPLDMEYQKIILDYFHFLGVRARNVLLLRLAGEKKIYEPLFYELCDKAGREARTSAWHRASELDRLAAKEIAEESLGFDVSGERESFFKQLGMRLLGLAY
ncbi:MAG: hypothetical protein VB078_04210 [Clostridiaceae bacterium]|nr:hypothetical protein [Clostridiaceae bacterium]